MSEEQRNEETEVEGHVHKVNAPKYSASDEPRDEAEAETDDEVEGHVHKVNAPKYS
jgi:hypothetical protein